MCVRQRNVKLAGQLAQAVAGCAGQQDRGQFEGVLHGAMEIDAAGDEESGVKAGVVRERVAGVRADEGQELGGDLLQEWGGSHVCIANAGELLNTQGDRTARVHKRDEAVKHFDIAGAAGRTREADGADFDNGVLLRLETGRFQIDGYVYALR